MNDQLEQLERRKNETANRLREIESPFGSIPMGIGESILFFPLGISAGFWISGSLLGDSLKLRKHYHSKLTIDMANSTKRKVDIDKPIEKEKEKEKKIEEKLSLLYPIWIDPITPLSIRTVKLVILSVPLVIFVTLLSLLIAYWEIIVSSPEIASIFVENIGDNMIIYVALYSLSAIFFLCGYWRIIKELKSYSAKTQLVPDKSN